MVTQVLFQELEGHRCAHLRVGDNGRVLLSVLTIELHPHHHRHRRESSALGEMQPLQIGRAVGVTNRRRETATAITLKDVFHHCARFEHRHAIVFQRRHLAEGRALAEGHGLGREGDRLDYIGQAELFEQP